ncbi:Fungal lipase-like domain - like 10 [Theobroma cacao]|uniref:Alpha/beta-Hydrolases superfamily protein n=1 Tax=Theobroma cacao TaxID=3641 RepID=A0A061DVN7_THECC|nr:Alpha/beta-Hydrolases superfamily protein [Theobroma cacao]WRX11076.1 Fungal lipase-like domain - like 10 [Theobroma cacao]
MNLSMKAARPCTFPATTTQTPMPSKHVSICCCTITQPVVRPLKKSIDSQRVKSWEHLLDPVDYNQTASLFTSKAVKIGNRWEQYQGIQNWEGLLDPLDENLRGEILRYGFFVEAAYRSFDFDSSSPTYATCRYPKSTFLDRSGLPETGYRLTRNLRATSGIQLPRWVEKAPSWVATQSSWIGYVAVCQDKEEIARLGRRDVVIAYRGTATGLEWLENLRATLTPLPNADSKPGPDGSEPMVESGFLSLYTSGTAESPSLQEMIREEILRLLQTYGDEPLSLTITGHSLGAALATLTAYDIKTTFKRAPLVTVMSFGGPRVGNRSFRRQLEKQGTKVLRIVNSDDLITKVPGFVLEEDADVSKSQDIHVAGLPSWIQKRVEDTQWVYAEVGRELRLRSRDSPYLNTINVATCHELKTYLHLVSGFVSSTCPFRATVSRVLDYHNRGQATA